MSEPATEPQPRRHEAGVTSFLAMPPADRYSAMAIGFGANGHIADEVLVTVSRRARREGWLDERKYTQQLMKRIYRHVHSHVAKNPGWQKNGGGFDATADDCAQYVVLKLINETDEICHAENAFGDYVYKRSLDFADTLYSQYQKKRLADESELDEFDNLKRSDGESYTPESYAEEMLSRLEKESLDDLKLERIYALVQEDGFLSELERIAFTYSWFGEIQIDSKDADKLTICKIMDRSDKSVRLYIGRAMSKIKERLQ